MKQLKTKKLKKYEKPQAKKKKYYVYGYMHKLDPFSMLLASDRFDEE